MLTIVYAISGLSIGVSMIVLFMDICCNCDL